MTATHTVRKLSTTAPSDAATTEIVVRPIEPADFEAVGRLTVDAYRADGQLDGDTGYDSVLADVAARAGDGEIFVAADPAGVVLGAVLFVVPGSRFSELAAPGEAEFRMLAVDPRAQGRGVGRALVRACIARAEHDGATAVVICTRDFSYRAHRLYEGLGFVRVPDLDWTPVAGVNLLGLRLDLPRHPRPST